MTYTVPWTDEQTATLCRVWPDTTIPREEIPAIVGRTLGACETRASKIGIFRRDGRNAPLSSSQRPATMARNCLRCGVGFDAIGRFNRLCRRCVGMSEGMG
jgi:hypothetical protein